MDPAQKRKSVKRFEIVREAVPGRRMRLTDIMSEGFSSYLMRLDGDFIAPTGARLSDILEALKPGDGEYSPDVVARAQVLQQDPADDPGKYLARAERELSATSPMMAGKTMLPGEDEEDQGEAQPPAVTPPAVQPPPVVAPPPTTIPVEVDPTVGAQLVDDNDIIRDNDGPGAQIVDLDTAKPGAATGDSNTATAPENREAGTEKNDVAVDQAPGDIAHVEDSADVPADDSSKELGGPDEFDEKNKPFTDYIDNLIGGKGSNPPVDSLSENSFSGNTGRYRRSLIEAVYGGRRMEIIRRS